MTDARQAALTVLLRVERENAYSNLTLSGETQLSEQDRALCYAIVLSVLERKLTLDYLLSQHLRQPIRKLEPTVHTVLRMGAAQILFMDRIPVSAAVNESVKLVKRNGGAYAAGLVNAVLRKVASTGLRLPEDDGRDETRSVLYSYPADAAGALRLCYGAQTAGEIMASSLEKHPVYVRRNTLSGKALPEGFTPAAWPEACFAASPDVFSDEESALRAGACHVQDRASQLLCSVAGARPGMRVIDVCAAPGGKTMTLAQHMRNEGRIVACDIHDHRLALIRQNAERLGVAIVQTLRRNAEEPDDLPPGDLVLCDVPCSGIGDAGAKPEVKYKPYAAVEGLAELQKRILSRSARLVRPGGRLIYSTCSLYRAENADVVSAFLGENQSFHAVPVAVPDESAVFRDDCGVTVLPGKGQCDGLFFCVMERDRNG